jgi:hypothetical protein
MQTVFGAQPEPRRPQAPEVANLNIHTIVRHAEQALRDVGQDIEQQRSAAYASSDLNASAIAEAEKRGFLKAFEMLK